MKEITRGKRSTIHIEVQQKILLEVVKAGKKVVLSLPNIPARKSYYKRLRRWMTYYSGQLPIDERWSHLIIVRQKDNDLIVERKAGAFDRPEITIL